MAKTKQSKPKRPMYDKNYPFNDWGGPLVGLDMYKVKIWEMAKKKFGLDADGDCPVNLKVIDRTKFEPMHYWAVPYDHLAKTEEEIYSIYQALSINLSLATQAMNRFVQSERARRVELREKQK